MNVFSYIPTNPLLVDDHQFPRDISDNPGVVRGSEIKYVLPYKVGTSHPGKFSPGYARYFRKVVATDKAHYLYYKPDHTIVYKEGATTNYTSMNSYNDIYHNLQQYTTSMGLYKFTVAGEDHYIIVGHQLIMDTKGNILYLGVSKGYQNTLNADTFRVYVASEFFNNETYKYVIKKLDSEFFEIYRQEGVEIVIKPSQAIEDEFYGPRVVTKYDSLTDFNVHKNELRDLLTTSMLGQIQNVAYNKVRFAMNNDVLAPSPVKYGYNVNNLIATMDPEHLRSWNQDWARKLLYIIMQSRVYYSHNVGTFQQMLENTHKDWNPQNWITFTIRNSNITLTDLVPDFIELSYSAYEHCIRFRANGMRMKVLLKVTHRNEFNLMQEEFGPIENVTFVSEEPSIPQEEEVSPEQDELSEVVIDGENHTITFENGQTQYTDSSGVRWSVRAPSSSTTVFNSDDGRYIAGMDPYNDDRTIAAGLAEMARQRGLTHSAVQSGTISFGDAVTAELRQYPVHPDDAFLRAEEDVIVGQQERPEGDETGAQLPIVGTVYEDDSEYEDDNDYEEAVDDTGQVPQVPDWVGEDNFTANEG